MKDPNEMAFDLAGKIEKMPNVLAADVNPASSTSQEPYITVIVEDLNREIFPSYPIKTVFRSINDKDYYMDRWGEAWLTFWMMDYMKTNEWKAKSKRKSWLSRVLDAILYASLTKKE